MPLSNTTASSTIAPNTSTGRQFIITELVQDSNGHFTDLPAQFKWDREGQSSPRQGWEYTVKLRTVREEYPGVSVPTEQVLGWAFEPFTLSGRWDDKYNFVGFAENNRIQFEQLVQRGNLVRLDFEGISVTGLITNFQPKYLRKYQIDWQFTFSPHFRDRGNVTSLAPEAISDPLDYYLQDQAIIDQAFAIHAIAPSPYIGGVTYSNIRLQIEDWQAKANTIQAIVNSRVLIIQDPGSQAVDSVSSLVQSFRSLQTSALNMLPLVQTQPTNSALFYEDAVINLTFEAWIRGLAFQARALSLSSYFAAADLDTRVDNKALALYRPRQGESLYAISNMFYKTPHRWRDIAARNKLTSVVLSGTELLVIPQNKVD